MSIGKLLLSAEQVEERARHLPGLVEHAQVGLVGAVGLAGVGDLDDEVDVRAVVVAVRPGERVGRVVDPGRARSGRAAPARSSPRGCRRRAGRSPRRTRSCGGSRGCRRWRCSRSRAAAAPPARPCRWPRPPSSSSARSFRLSSAPGDGRRAGSRAPWRRRRAPGRAPAGPRRRASSGPRATPSCRSASRRPIAATSRGSKPCGSAPKAMCPGRVGARGEGRAAARAIAAKSAMSRAR